MSFLGGLFKKKEVFEPIDLSEFKTDIHSHLIPGIDDGARTMDETIAMLAKFECLGFQKVITTPHILSDYYKNTPEIILSGLEKVRKVSNDLGLKIQIEAAAEYYFDESLIERLNNEEQLLTFGDNYVLVEFSFVDEPVNVENLFFQLITRGYKPVVAHFERYLFLKGDISRAKKWREDGVFIQLNLNSLTEHYGSGVKLQAERLIESEQIDFVGSDCHRIEHLLLLENNLSLPYMNKLSKLKLLNKNL